MITHSSCPRRQVYSFLSSLFWIPTPQLSLERAFAGVTPAHFISHRNAQRWIQRLFNSHVNLGLFFTFCFSFCLPFPVFAGHGFASAFGNIEWLPEPGRTPESIWYRLDAVREEGQLLLSRTTSDKSRLCLTFAREKLAELEAMTKAENSTAATTAVERYRAYLDRVHDLATNETTDKEVLVEQFASALLEHQYILSVIYPELPVSTRAVVLQAATAARDHYQEIAKLLPQKKKGALFFKEEEVRWSMDMATREEEKPE